MTRSPLDRREFFQKAGHSALALGGAAYVAPLAFAADAPPASSPAPESLVKLLFDSLTPGQRERVCFAWDHQHPEWGLLRTRVSANWNITDEVVDSKFYTPEQQELVHAIYRGIIAPEWHERYDQQQDDDAGGFGANNSIAIFGTPGEGPSELVLTGRHMTLRCDGNSAEHVAFGGPIFYVTIRPARKRTTPTTREASSGRRRSRRIRSTRRSTASSSKSRW